MSSDKQQRNVCESSCRCLAECSKWMPVMSSAVKRLRSFTSHNSINAPSSSVQPLSLLPYLYIFGWHSFLHKKGPFTIILKTRDETKSFECWCTTKESFIPISACSFIHSEDIVLRMGKWTHSVTVSGFSEDVDIEHSKKRSGFGLKNRLLCLYFQPHVTDLAAAFRLRLLVENGSYPSCDLLVQRRGGWRNPPFLHGDTRQLHTIIINFEKRRYYPQWINPGNVVVRWFFFKVIG